jgi:ribosomal protein L10
MKEGTLSAEDIIRLSKLPTREILYAQLVSNLEAPLFGLVHSLNWNIQKIVRTLAEVQKKRQTVQ